jgi:hypothetical protein
MSKEEKYVYHLRADEEKRLHAIMYPLYKFSPSPRKLPVTKRASYSDGDVEVKRCESIASLVKKGLGGEELELAMKKTKMELAGGRPLTYPETD